MKISVAIATFNRRSMVREAVLAALVQSRAPEEIVVADDASTDGTVDEIEGIRDARVRVLRRESNSGGVGNWNAAMNAVSGDLIAWCSDDDRFTEGHLEASAAYLEAHPEIGMVHSGFFDWFEVDGVGKLEPRRLRPAGVLNRAGLARYMIRYYDWPFHPSTLVLRREVWERTGPFDARYALADTDWFVRAAQTTRIARLARRGCVNRRHAGNWSNRVGSASMQREIFEIVERGIEGRVWKFLWRMNVRARLALTLRVRMAGGHSDAACAAWHGMLQDTGARAPLGMERLGARLIRWWCAGRDGRGRDVRERVSPL
jgi:glycosyltransferase involved in cell wall biosynthesis